MTRPAPGARSPSLSLVALAALALLLGGCGQDRPQNTVWTRAEAEHDQRAMRLKVVKTFDNASGDFSPEPFVWWVVDVEVVDGPADLIGTTLTLPYDDRIVGEPVPKPGTVVVTSPAAWVHRNSKGKVGVFGQ